MGWISRFLVAVILVGLIGGGLFLMTWDIPPPSATVEKTIPNDRFTD